MIYTISSINGFEHFFLASSKAASYHPKCPGVSSGILNFESRSMRAGLLKVRGLASTNDAPYLKSNWLVDMGFSEDEVHRMRRKFPSEQVETNLWKTAKVLRDEVGLSEEDISRALLRMYPDLDLSATADLRPKLAFWKQERGLSDKDLHRMVRAFPQMLVCRLEENVRPSVRFLQRELILSEQETNKVLLTVPSLLHFNSTTNLLPKIVFWREERGLFAKDVGRMILRSPTLLHFNRHQCEALRAQR
uniref:Uncharacterized protein n=1 Tax=Heterosigma akashiwo TaxID=2829 RepID=A0A7S3Y0U0_HETAK